MAFLTRPLIRRPALTVLEVLVVLAVCILALGLGAIVVMRHRENAQRVVCQNNLRVLGAAILAYHGMPKDKNPRLHLPPSRIADSYATWAVLIAPHMLKNDHRLNRWDVERSYFAQQQEVREATVVLQFCPTRTRADAVSEVGDIDAEGTLFPGGLGDYAAVAGDGSVNHDWTTVNANGPLIPAEVLERKVGRVVKWRSLTTLDSLKRGASNTLLVGEKHALADHLGDAGFGDGSLYNGQHSASFARAAGPGFPLAAMDAPFNNNFGSWHRGICNFLLADGGVRPTAIDIDDTILGRLARRGE